MSKVVSRIAQIASSFVLLVGATLSSSGAADYTLRPDDKVKIKVYEWPELSSEFTVNSDGKITLPLIGEVSVIGLRPAQVSDAISDRLQKKANMPDRPISSVEIIQVQPIFVLGDVTKPGDYPYRPGMTVLQAISVAGGFYRPTDIGLLRLERDIITGRGELEALLTKITRLTARQARLNAEFQDRNDVEFPPELTQDKIQATAQIMADERAAFVTGRDSLLRKIDSFSRISKIYEQEIQSLGAQILTEKSQQDSVLKELDQVREMATKGLGLAPRQLTLERTVLQLAEVQQGLETQILRARQNIATTEQLAIDARNERRTKAAVDLQTTHAELDEAQKRIDTVQHLIYEASVTAPTQARELTTIRNRKHDVLISRKQRDEIQKMPADETFFLEPGDLVEVIPTPMPGPKQADAATRQYQIDGE